MADVLQSAMQWLASQQEEHVARSVQYTRGSDSVTLTVTIGRTRSQQQDRTGQLRTVFTDRDYLIRAADLILAGSSTTPQKGDRIADVDEAGAAATYEVQPPGTGVPQHSASDSYGVRFRVHTKRVA